MKSNTPLIYISSLEEERVIKAIETCCIRTYRKMWCYAISEGLWTVDFYNTKELIPEIVHGKANPDYRDPIEILRQIKDIHIPKQGAVFVLLDFHEYLTDGMVRRHLRDMKTLLKEQNSSIIILAPFTSIPQSLAHEVWCYAFPLPTCKEMATQAKTLLTRTRLTIRESLTDETLAQIAAAGQGHVQRGPPVAQRDVLRGGEVDLHLLARKPVLPDPDRGRKNLGQFFQYLHLPD